MEVQDPRMRKTPGFIFLLILFSCAVTPAFADRAQALAAYTRGDFANAIKLWQELANEGDPVAQYNLALLYQQGAGVSQDNNMSGYWLSMAARRNMVDAYRNINLNSVNPAAQRVAVVVQLSPMDWVASQNPDYYTLQLASSTNEQLIQKYYSENELAGKAGYYHSRRGEEDWYALVYGAYPSVTEAKSAIDSLPGNLRKWSPWVRNIRSIHKLMIR